MNNWILTFIMTFFLGFTNGQCSLSNMTAMPSECNDLGKFSVFINFNHTGNSDSFNIVGNGKHYGKFSYNQLPLGLEGFNADCSTSYEFVARDAETENCSTYIDFGTKCCENNCNIYFTDAVTTLCENGNFLVSFGLNHENAPTNGFDLHANGKFLGYYSYEDLPLQNIKIEGSKLESKNQIVVCANDQPNCCDTLLVNNDCYCNFNNIRYQIVECNEDSETFSIRLTFDHINTQDSFKIGGNGHNYGSFAYNELPIKIDNLEFKSEGTYEFLFIDKEDALCFGTLEVPHIDTCVYDCTINNLNVKTTDCIDGSFYAILTMNTFNTGLKGFLVRGNGTIYDTFVYGKEAYKIGPLKGDCTTIYEFVVIDEEDAECRDGIHLPAPICCNESCDLAEMRFDIECNNDSILQYVYMNLSHTATSDSFDLLINDKFIARYAYSQLPIKLAANVFSQERNKFLVRDSKNQDCAVDKILEIACSLNTCGFRDVSIVPQDCIDGFYSLKVSFINPGHGSQGFTIKVDNISYGTFEYGRDFYIISAIPANCPQKSNIVIRDIQFENCVIEKTYGPVCCEGCDITNLTVKASECNENGLFYAIIKFDSYAKGKIPIIVKVNDIVFDTIYQDKDVYEIGPLEPNCDVAHKFLLDVLGQPECKEDIRLSEPKCCDACEINSPRISLSPCDDGKFDLTLNFTHQNTSSSFKVKVNDQVISPLYYSDLPIVIHLEANQAYNIGIQDNDKGDCTLLFTLPEVDCTSDVLNTQISSVTISDLGESIGITSELNWNVRLINLEGRMIKKYEHVAGQSKIDKDALPQGIYFVQFSSESITFAKKILVMH
ncbi:MAG: T9SS type A sorting domain-containing protein [Saprospiraceae bacterium]